MVINLTSPAHLFLGKPPNDNVTSGTSNVVRRMQHSRLRKLVSLARLWMQRRAKLLLTRDSDRITKCRAYHIAPVMELVLIGMSGQTLCAAIRRRFNPACASVMSQPL